MIDFDNVTKENRKEHNPIWLQIPEHPYRILLIGGFGSRKTNSFLNLISHQPDLDKIYLYVKNLYEGNYQFLINKRKSEGLKRLNDFIAWMIFTKILKHKI